MTPVGILITVGPDSVNLKCPSCNNSIQTEIRYKANNRTHLTALMLCLFLCWPCILIPYCKKSCKNANHYCPDCGTFIGTYFK